MSLCLVTAAKATKIVTAVFTLIWTHSVEKTRWEENWSVGPAGLTLESARVKGSGAGMEPPPEARLEKGWYRWRVGGAPLRELVLARSAGVEDWRICTPYECLPLDLLLPDRSGPIRLSHCP